MTDEQKLALLEDKLKKYQDKLKEMLMEKTPGAESRYGDEYHNIQMKVYQEMILTTKKEILEIRKKLKLAKV